MIATIAAIDAIAQKKKSSAIAATTIAEIELFLSQQSLTLRSLECSFHIITTIATIAKLFFSQRSQRS